LKKRRPNYVDIAITLNNIGIIYANKNKNKSALKYYKEPLKFQLGIENPKEIDLADIATTYSNIGCIYACQRLFSKALNIQLKHLPKGHPYFVQTFISLARCYSSLKNHSVASEYFQKALDILVNYSDVNRLLLSEVYSNIGFCYESMDVNSMALKYYKISLKYTLKLKIANHSRVNISFEKLFRDV
jgi:tetratricopeptide (TPR) repeat protein